MRLVETKLTMKDFSKFFERGDLGKLNFPNGEVFIPSGPYIEWGKNVPLFVNLVELYKAAVGWKVNETAVELDDIIAIIAYGSAVQYPGYDEHVQQYKKYLLFGPMRSKVERVPVRPRDIDFLVVTRTNLYRREVIAPEWRDVYGGAGALTKAGIHLVNRSRINIIRGVRAGDTVSSTAIEQGVPVFTTSEFWKLRKDTKLTQKNPRKIYWDTNNRGLLHGEIQ